MEAYGGSDQQPSRGGRGRGRGYYRGGYDNQRGGGRGGYGRGGYNNNRPPPNNYPWKTDKFTEEDQVALKIRGLPYQTRFEEILDFFKEFNYVEKSVVMGIGQDGRKNGFASILFQSHEDAKKAMDEMQRGHIGSRYVELSVISYGDYLRFNGPIGGGNYVRLSKYVSNDNKEKCIVMRGLPYRITPEEIITFFEGFGNLTTNDIFIEENNSKRTGSALVIFENEDVAQDAKSSLNKKTIGEEQRWVELHDCHDQFMQKICNLYN